MHVNIGVVFLNTGVCYNQNVPVANWCVSFKILSLEQKGSKLRVKSMPGDPVQQLNLSLRRPMQTQMLSSPESVTDPLPLCSLWKCTWGDLPPLSLPPKALCRLPSRATQEVSEAPHHQSGLISLLFAHKSAKLFCKGKTKSCMWLLNNTGMNWTSNTQTQLYYTWNKQWLIFTLIMP